MTNTKLALYLSAEKYRLAKSYQKAIKQFEEIVQIEPTDVGILKKLATLYPKVNLPDKAADTHVAIASIHRDNDKREMALSELQNALGVQADHGPAQRMLRELENKGQPSPEVESEPKPAEPEEQEIPPIKLDTPLFKDLNDQQLESIVQVITSLQILKDTVVFEEGDTSNSLYIVEQGSFEVRTKIPYGTPGKDDNVFSVLSTGDFFGEFAFLTGKSRVATVKAREDSVIYQLTKENLDSIIAQYPEIEERLFLFYKSRALDLVLAKSALFHKIPAQERRELLELFVLWKVKAGETIIQEGQKDDNLFLIKKGELRVETTNNKGQKIFLSGLSQHQFFGEISFLTGVPRTADVIASSDCEILVIGKEDLEKIIAKYPSIENVLISFQQSRALSTVKKLTSSPE